MGLSRHEWKFFKIGRVNIYFAGLSRGFLHIKGIKGFSIFQKI